MHVKISLVKIISCLVMFFYCSSSALGQFVNGKPLKPVGGDILHADARVAKYRVSIVKIVDGVIHTETFVPAEDVAQEWMMKNTPKLTIGEADSLLITNTTNTPLENYVLHQVKEQTDTIVYKLPIILNERFIEWYIMRRESYRFIKPSDIRLIKFLSKEAAQNKYGNTILFGAIEIYK